MRVLAEAVGHLHRNLLVERLLEGLRTLEQGRRLNVRDGDVLLRAGLMHRQRRGPVLVDGWLLRKRMRLWLRQVSD